MVKPRGLHHYNRLTDINLIIRGGTQMVKNEDKNNSKRQGNQEEAGCPAKASKIGHSTPYDYCNERLSP